MNNIEKAIDKLKKVNSDASKERIRQYLVSELAKNDEQLALGVLQEHKTIDSCFKHIVDWASKQKRTGNCYVAADEDVYGQAIHYFTDVDDKPKTVANVEPVVEAISDDDIVIEEDDDIFSVDTNEPIIEEEQLSLF